MDIQQKGNIAVRPSVARALVLALLLASVVALQFAYDRVKPAPLPGGQAGELSASAVRMADLGFHSTIASFMWIATMPEILKLFFTGDRSYLTDRAFLNAVDPKLSYPYAFSVLTLPVVKIYPGSVDDALAIGQQGIANSDPDWRIPYYMAIDYYLEKKDLKSATWYFNIAAETPGVPEFARRFSLNFGINQRERDRVRGIWSTIYASTNDPDTKARAAAYVLRLNDFDYLEAAAKAYKQKYGVYPATPAALVEKGIITAVPEDPFGYDFKINKDGTVGIDLSKEPSYLTQPSQ